MNKKDCQAYLDRWKLVEEIERRELKTASPELLVRQTMAIWDMGRALGFSEQTQPEKNSWADLQNKWKSRDK